MFSQGELNFGLHFINYAKIRKYYCKYVSVGMATLFSLVLLLLLFYLTLIGILQGCGILTFLQTSNPQTSPSHY